jgi:hypothetical protein
MVQARHTPGMDKTWQRQHAAAELRTNAHVVAAAAAAAAAAAGRVGCARTRLISAQLDVVTNLPQHCEFGAFKALQGRVTHL